MFYNQTMCMVRNILGVIGKQITHIHDEFYSDGVSSLVDLAEGHLAVYFWDELDCASPEWTRFLRTMNSAVCIAKVSHRMWG